MVKSGKKVRLIRKTSMTLLWISGALTLVSTVALYFYVRNFLEEEVEEDLYATKARIELVLSDKLTPSVIPPFIVIEPADIMKEEVLKDTIIYDPSQDEMELFRELTSYTDVGGTLYKITLRILVVESDDILLGIVISYIIIIALVFSILYYLNRSSNKTIWAPFFRNLERMKHFSLASHGPIELEESDILEFTELNREIATLTHKVRSDYENLKQFTEDVSHEMQTPLAIIQAKIENIVNENIIDDRLYDHFTSIQKDIKRLTQLNKRLTLLTKIENNQFIQQEKVDITGLLADILQNFKELSSREISYHPESQITVNMDPYLAEIMCTNLITNAIKYSVLDDVVHLQTTGDQLVISNRGKGPIRQPQFLFNRFYREATENKATGLGLAIVKKICDVYGHTIDYRYSDQKHFFTVSFKNANPGG